MSKHFEREGPDDREVSSFDLSAVQADDALLDALAGSDPKAAAELGTAQLNALLLTWSHEVDSEPLPELVDLDTAVKTIKTTALRNRPPQRGSKRRFLVSVAAAAAVLGIVFSGAGVAARDAQPGDALWALTKLLYADKADSVQASYDVRLAFQAAQDALDRGAWEEARNALERAESRLREVGIEENLEWLKQQHKQLMDRLEADPAQQDEPRSSPISQSPAATTSPSPSPSPDSAEAVPEPAETTTPLENSTPDEPAPDESAPDEPPPPTTTTPDSEPTSEDASPSGSRSQPGAGSAGEHGKDNDHSRKDDPPGKGDPPGKSRSGKDDPPGKIRSAEVARRP